ncbi:MAG: DUF4230 domain-containing protein [Bacteroidales bacterium]|nr:DUF4230 domain-containing protein [Bacteroidales bacterium]MBD5241496.1 DUF4230 domain-containing protein [Barnesiella sp.]MDE5821304.1 DUF4230 domain-containing protein [Paramuribaculum sp.]MDE5836030.1 DUF4230 domain-containing protein [Paramuribaculum sp.]
MKYLCLLAFGILIFSSCDKIYDKFKRDSDRVNVSKELYQEIKSADKMVFASMAITKTAKLQSEDWYKLGKRIAVYSYDSYMRAYIDLSELKMEDIVFNDDERTVTVNLPPIITEITGRDMELHKEYENIGLLRSEIDSKERALIKEMANSSFKKEVEGNATFRKQLTDEAKRKARNYFEAIFDAYGYTANIYFNPSKTSGYEND